MYRYFFKHILTYLISLITLIITLPLFIIIAIMIKLDSKGPVFFKQKRLGKNGKQFTIYKFRTMFIGSEEQTKAIVLKENNPLITKIGKFLRKTSLDELPQLVNILKFQMTIIGPRPLLADHPYTYENYPIEYKDRFKVLPGLFCLIDVEKRAEASLEEQFISDVMYVNNVKIFSDIKIFSLVFINVIRRKNVYEK